MPTKNEIKEIERVYQKLFSEIEELDIPTIIRNREKKEEAEFQKEIEAEQFNERAREKLERQEFFREYWNNYPVGKQIERYDIWREKELLEGEKRII